MSFEAYSVAVKLSLVNHTSMALSAISADLMRVNRGAAAAQAGLAGLHTEMIKIKRLGLIGGAMAGAGFGMLSMLKGPLEEAKLFEQQMGKFKLFGMSDAQNTEALNFAKNMNIMGNSARENLKLMTEAQGVFRESGMAGSAALDGAKLAAPYLAKINFSASTLDEESAAKLKTSSKAMLRYVDMSGGLQSAAKFNELANAGWKLTQTSGGAVDWEQLRQYKARAGVSGQYETEEGLAMMEPIIAELKGSTAGFASRTAYNRLNGIIKVPNQVASELLKNGIWDKDKVTLNAMGGIKAFNGNPLKDSALMMQNKIKFYEKNFKPMYDKANLSPEERARKNAMFFGSTGGMEFSLIDKQLPAIHRSLDAYHQAKTVDESYKVAGGTLAGQEADLHAKWKNVMLELGVTILPMAINSAQGLTAALKGFTEFAKNNPGVIKALTVAFVALGVSMAFGGTVILLTASMRGLGIAFQFLGAGGIPGIAKAGMAISGVGTVIGKLGAIGFAFAAGWTVGTILNDTLISGTKFGDRLGGFIAHILAAFGNKDAQAAIDSNKSPAARAAIKAREDAISARQDRSDSHYLANVNKSGPSSGASLVPPTSSKTVQVATTVNMDGFKVANIISKHQTTAASMSSIAGGNRFDSTMSLAPVGGFR